MTTTTKWPGDVLRSVLLDARQWVMRAAHRDPSARATLDRIDAYLSALDRPPPPARPDPEPYADSA